LATSNKNFKVKNGLDVSGAATASSFVKNGGTATEFLMADGSVSAGSGSSIEVSEIPPENPTNGSQWFDTIVERLNIYYSGRWITIATIDDTLTVPNHIHDENGLVVSTFIDGAGPDATPQGTVADGGTPFTTDWENTFNGGFAVSNYS
jgi:hypothetical protein